MSEVLLMQLRKILKVSLSHTADAVSSMYPAARYSVRAVGDNGSDVRDNTVIAGHKIMT
jgi:hypothetical protein